MAYASSRGSARTSRSQNGGPRSGNSRGPAPRGGGANLAALAIAAVVVVGVIVVIVATSGGGGPPKAPPPAATPTTNPTPAVVKPTAPAEKPYPPLAPDVLAKGRTLVSSFAQKSADADRLYKESLQAKQAGDTAAWQSKLRDARALLDSIKDEWNEFEGGLPTGNGYDSDQVAAHYFAHERGQVQKFTKNLAAMKSDQR